MAGEAVREEMVEEDSISSAESTMLSSIFDLKSILSIEKSVIIGLNSTVVLSSLVYLFLRSSSNWVSELVSKLLASSD